MTFADRFPDMTASVFYGSGQESLQDYTPVQSPINTGMLSDIGRATVWGPETQQNPFARFMRNPLIQHLILAVVQSTNICGHTT